MVVPARGQAGMKFVSRCRAIRVPADGEAMIVRFEPDREAAANYLEPGNFSSTVHLEIDGGAGVRALPRQGARMPKRPLAPGCPAGG